MQNKKYFVCANTHYIKDYIEPINFKYTFSGKSFKNITENFVYDFNFTKGFFQHICFYEIFFNEDGRPTHVHCLGNEDDDFETPNGWYDFHGHMEKVNYHNFFLKDEDGEYWFDDNFKLYERMWKWGKEITKEIIKEKIVDLLTYGE